MGLLSWLFGKNEPEEPALTAEQESRLGERLSTLAPELPDTSGLSRRDIFSSHDQSKQWVKDVREANRRLQAASVRTAQVYTYTWKGLPKLRRGERISMRRSDATTLHSTYTGSTWSKRSDGGTAFSYRGRTCCVVFSQIVDGLDSVTMVCQGQFSADLPELRVEVRKVCDVQSESRYVPRNRRPSGLRELKASRTVALSGEEIAQEVLERYEDDALVWMTVRRGLIPKGKSKGEPTLWFALDGVDVGYLTPLQGRRQYGQVPSEGAMCLARIKRGTKKYEVTVHLPDYEKQH
ncbi:hypothetical protein [Bifidobacterium choerinum]|uniref:Uncharacterized protein n=1 Tax=Bifidobacterium choerinum TaxID=35760 RepID=A0A2D3D6W0_9BIFI|nr:hypothetical protein [Bifidobacterium choerinum]ATU20845.1 hypothetical protein BcFMB_07810 [Bifidobacterium choerinum]